MIDVDSERIVKRLHTWNTDPMMAGVMRGRQLLAQQGELGLIVTWTDGASLRVYTMPYQKALEEGWGDMLTDLLRILDKKAN